MARLHQVGSSRKGQCPHKLLDLPHEDQAIALRLPLLERPCGDHLHPLGNVRLDPKGGKGSGDSRVPPGSLHEEHPLRCNHAGHPVRGILRVEGVLGNGVPEGRCVTDGDFLASFLRKHALRDFKEPSFKFERQTLSRVGYGMNARIRVEGETEMRPRTIARHRHGVRTLQSSRGHIDADHQIMLASITGFSRASVEIGKSSRLKISTHKPQRVKTIISPM